MPKRLDRTGRRYGRLTVVDYAGKDERGKLLWRCICDCGNEKIVVGDNLSSGKSKSCGCLLTEFLHRKGDLWELSKDREDAILKVQYNHVARRNHKFTGEIMPYEVFKNKVKQPCHYCGLEYSRTLHDRYAERKDGKLLSDTVIKINGIDRINSNIGYTDKNTVSCCKHCNTAKNTLSQKEFKEWIIRVYENYVK